jgi:hypothetical protein
VNAHWRMAGAHPVEGDYVGISPGEPTAKHGLGAGIVEARAKHLLAQIDVAVANPGTAITLPSMKSALDGAVSPAAARQAQIDLATRATLLRAARLRCELENRREVSGHT